METLGSLQLFELFTDEARQVVVAAQQETRLLRHRQIGAEDLLLGILHRDRYFQAFTVLGVGLDQVREQVEVLVPRARTEPSGYVPFTQATKRVLELALQESRDLRQDHIEPGHLLLGVLRVHGDHVDQVLAALGLDAKIAYVGTRAWLAAGPWELSTATSHGAHGRTVAETFAGLRQQRDRLVAALARYGKHEEDCPAPESPCTCGLDAAVEDVGGRARPT